MTNQPLVSARRTDVPATFDERTILTTLLEYVRLTVHAKCAGLTQENAALAPLPTSPLISIAGLVSHLRWVEASWIDVVLLGGEDHGPWTDDDPDREMRIGPDRPIKELLSEYAEQAAHTDAIVATHDWDTETVRRNSVTKQPYTLRWIILHLIEETARHNGHIDLLREMADGVRGD